MRQKRVLVILVALATILSLAACQASSPAATSAAPAATSAAPAAGESALAAPTAAGYADKITISMDVIDADKSGQAAKDEWFVEKFNIEWKYIPVTWGDWLEKVRAMVAADDMPDILWWDMKLNNTSEFRAWAQQGAFKEIPADLSKWPELAKQRDVLTSDDKVVTVDGKLYGWPAYRNNPDWLKNAYYPMFAYRRDWAKTIGLYKEGDTYTWDEVKAMIKAVQEKDPGKNGVGNTFGMTSETWAFPGTFMEILGYQEDRNGYEKIDGKWQANIAQPGFLEEVKFVSYLYRSGYIWKDQMVVTGNEGADNFFAGRSFMFLGNNSPTWFNDTFTKMLGNKTITSNDQVAPMIVLSPKDNKSFWLTQTEDYWTVANLNHKVDDAKMNRILDMWNWLLTEDGRRFQVAGIPGTDYKDNGGKMEILWPKNDDGSYKNPYFDLAFNEYTPATLLARPYETDRTEGFDAFKSINQFMQTSSDYHVHPLNWDVTTFGGAQFSQYGAFNSDVTAKIKEIMGGKDDITAAWNAFVAEYQAKMQPVIDELNSQLK